MGRSQHAAMERRALYHRRNSYDCTWVRHLTGGDVAIALPNLGDDGATLKVCATDIGVSATAVTAMEVWTRKSLTPSAAGDYSLTVASHDTALLYLSPRHAAAA